MAGYEIADDEEAVAFPTVYPVADLLCFGLLGGDVIVLNSAMLAVLKVYAKEIAFKPIADDAHMMAVVNLDASHVCHR